MENFNPTWLGYSAAEIAARLRTIAADIHDVGNGVTIEPSVMITDWSMAHRVIPCLIGTAGGHPSIDDGREMITSPLFYFDETLGIARTLSRWYRLGQAVRDMQIN